MVGNVKILKIRCWNLKLKTRMRGRAECARERGGRVSGEVG